MKTTGGVRINKKGSARDKMSNAVDYLQNWILDFVSKSNPDLNNFPPCPFAKQALIDSKIKFLEVKSIKHCIETIRTQTSEWDDKLDLVALVFTKLPNASTLVEEIENINQQIGRMDFVVLEDHPEVEENVNGVIMNNGKYAICLMQRLSKIQTFSNILRRQGYYNVWSEENMEDVVNWRSDLVPDS